MKDIELDEAALKEEALENAKSQYQWRSIDSAPYNRKILVVMKSGCSHIATKRKKHGDWWSENRVMRESPIGWQPRIGARKATIQRLEQEALERVNNINNNKSEEV